MSIIQTLEQTVNGNFTGGDTRYLIETPAGVLYAFFIDTNSDPTFSKSTDGGLSWTRGTVLKNTTTIAMAVWYDRWSGIAAGLIHVVYTSSSDDDIFYRSVDTESSDALSTETTVFAGSTTAAGGSLSITRARGGNLVVAGSIDAGAEDGAWESGDVGATWAGTIADPSEASTQDQYLLLPGWNADTQDVMLIFWDAGANALSVKRYDDSADTWTETSIATSMTDRLSSVDSPCMNATVDLTNSRNIVVAWSDTDAANADLRCWLIDDTSITEVTNVVLNATLDTGMCGISIDTRNETWIVFYFGKSDGSETYNTDMNLYYKTSVDSGTTWGPEILATPYNVNARKLTTVPRISSTLNVQLHIQTLSNTVACLNLGGFLKPRSTYIMGI